MDREELKHKIYLRMCVELGKMTTCPRRAFGSILVTKEGRVRGTGYNGTPKGTPNLCGGDYCLRDGSGCSSCWGDGNIRATDPDSTLEYIPCRDCKGTGKINAIESGTQNEVGCLHSEMNLLLNSSLDDLEGGTLYINGEPCPLCAKYIVQSGVANVICVDGAFSTNMGVDYMRDNGVIVTKYKMEDLDSVPTKV